MTAGIISIVASVIGFIIWLWKRNADEAAKPQTVLNKYEDEARKIIAAGGQRSINEYFDQRLRNISNNSSGQGSHQTGNGQTIQPKN